MADSRRYCSRGCLPPPPDWNKRYCPSCSGRLRLRLTKKRNASGGSSRLPEEDRPPNKEREPRSVKLSRRLVKPGAYSREKSVLGPRFHVMSPVAILILNILSLGLRSTIWISNRTRPLFMMARPEEKNINAILLLWTMSFYSYLILLIFIVFNIWVNDIGITAYLAESIPARAAAVMFALSFMINRHILYWAREVIIDVLRKNELDVIRSRALSFAPSPMMIWFAGVPYIQYHINRMIKKKGLNTYKPSKSVRVKKTRGGNRHNSEEQITPGLAAEV